MSNPKLETREQFEAWLANCSFTMELAAENAPPGQLLAVPAHMVKELYEALRPRWVPVSERLPDCGLVLVAFDEPFFGGFTKQVAVGYYDNPEDYDPPVQNGGWRFDLPDRPIKGRGVTHWMPLPPLPEES